VRAQRPDGRLAVTPPLHAVDSPQPRTRSREEPDSTPQASRGTCSPDPELHCEPPARRSASRRRHQFAPRHSAQLLSWEGGLTQRSTPVIPGDTATPAPASSGGQHEACLVCSRVILLLRNPAATSEAGFSKPSSDRNFIRFNTSCHLVIQSAPPARSVKPQQQKATCLRNALRCHQAALAPAATARPASHGKRDD